MIRLGLVGDPVDHSLSPAMHRAALAACGIEGDYVLFPVAAGDDKGLRDLLQTMRDGDLGGLNVTIPHKQTITGLVDELTLSAAAVGAVNTVVRRGDIIVGDNTDVPGFREAVRRFLGAHGRRGSPGRSAVILGAGGSARAAAFALGDEGWEVTVAARRAAQARQLAGDLAGLVAHVLDYADLSRAVRGRLAGCALIVNATPVGMAPHTQDSPWPRGLPFPRQAALYDLVYIPSITRVVREAREQAVPATTGLEMLIEQARLSFAHWTGLTPTRDVMRNAAKHQLEVVPCSDS